MNLEKFLTDSGILVVPLIGCSIISLTVILERLWFWVRFQAARSEATRRRVLSGDTRLGESRDRVARVLKEYMDRPEDSSVARSEAERLVRDSMAHLKILHWIATLSTSLGLLGTVVGVSLTLKDLQNQEKLVAGLSVALNTTIIGLVIYLFTYSFVTWFSSRSTALKVELKELLGEARRSAWRDRPRPASGRRPAPVVAAGRRSA